MASPKKLYPGQREGETVLQYLRRKRWEESQLQRLGIAGMEGLTDQELLQPIGLTPDPVTTAVAPQTKEKTVITQVDDEAVPDKVVTTIEQADPTTKAPTPSPMEYPLPTGQDDPTGAAYGGRFETGSSDAKIQGMLQDAMGQQRVQERAEAGFPPRDEFSEFATPDKGMLHYLLNPLEKFPATELGDSPYADTMIRDQQEREGLIPPPTTGEEEQEGILSFTGPNIAERITEETVTRAAPTTKVEVKPKADASTVKDVDVKDAPPEVRAALEREWGKWTYKPRERRDKFMGQLNRIYAKGAMLDAIAAFSGGQSRSGAYIERAMGKLNAITKFDQEERLYNIWRDVYYKNGVYDAPKTKKEAAERARRLGASPEETKSIYGWAEEGADLQQWWRYAPDGTVEVTQMTGKKEEPEQGDGAKWRQGSGPTSTTTVKVPWRSPDGKSQYTLAQGVTPKSIGMGEGWTIGTKDPTDKEIPVGSIDFIENVYQNRRDAGDDEDTARTKAAEAAFLQYNQDPEMYAFMSVYDDPTKRESARKEIDNIVNAYLERGSSFKSHGQPGATNEPLARAKAPAAAVAALKNNPTEEMKRLFKDKYGYLPEDM